MNMIAATRPKNVSISTSRTAASEPARAVPFQGSRLSPRTDRADRDRESSAPAAIKQALSRGTKRGPHYLPSEIPSAGGAARSCLQQIRILSRNAKPERDDPTDVYAPIRDATGSRIARLAHDEGAAHTSAGLVDVHGAVTDNLIGADANRPERCALIDAADVWDVRSAGAVATSQCNQGHETAPHAEESTSTNRACPCPVDSF